MIQYLNAAPVDNYAHIVRPFISDHGQNGSNLSILQEVALDERNKGNMRGNSSSKVQENVVPKSLINAFGHTIFFL